MKNNNKQDIILFEEMASNAHVALNIMQYDGWILKFSEGHTNRANSVSMIYPSTINVNEKIQNCEKIYSEQNLPCVFKLTDGDEEMMKLLIERGYKEVTPSDVMIREIDDITMPEGDITFYNKPVEEWLCPYFEYEGFSQKSQAIYRRMLDKLCIKTDYLAIREQGKIVALASSAMERGYLLIQNVVVHPDYRRKGYVSEAVRAYIQYFFEHYNEDEIIAVIKENNIRSWKVADNTGFRLLETRMYKDIGDENEESYRFYVIKRNQLKAWIELKSHKIRQTGYTIHNDQIQGE